MKRKEDMNKYSSSSLYVEKSSRTKGEFATVAGATFGTMAGMVFKTIKTVFWVLCIAGLLVFISLASHILSYRNVEPPNISDMSLSYSSMVYLDNPDGTSTEYLSLYSNENRVWIPLNEIPIYMKTAQIAIEDHRFMSHHGVDWRGTLGAVYKLATNAEGGGGSTITQQLIKNITGENQVSIKRKIKEIFTALNLEGGYTSSDGVHHVGNTKEEILEAYLNVVNYGGQCQGVEAAANFYFGKSITECDLAECALIAGICQNPWQYNPILFPDDAKERAEVVLDRMLELSEQGALSSRLTAPISKSEHDEAVSELNKMDFLGEESGNNDEEDEDDVEGWNWYIDLMFEDVVDDLMEKYGYSEDVAEAYLYNAGYEIHCAMDLNFQNDIEDFFLSRTTELPEDPNVQLGFYMMDPYTGRVMAVVGSRYEKTAKRVFSFASDASRPSGSAIKPISPYAVGIMTGKVTYGSVLNDRPLPNYPNNGPSNFSGTYKGYMCVDKAIAESQNAPAAWLCNDVTPEACYDYLTESLHFTTLTEDDSHSISAMALGGQSWGVTVEQMVAGFAVYASGGIYHEPMTYYYVKDHDGNVILDNRPEVNPGDQVMTLEQATVLNKLLQCPVRDPLGTLYGNFSDLDMNIYGKTGTTDDEYDIWTIIGTDFCTMGMWTGYEYPREQTNTRANRRMLRELTIYLRDNYDWSQSGSWVLSENVTTRTFCRDSGKLAGPKCTDVAQGWYEVDNMPGTCNGLTDHITGRNVVTSPSPIPTIAPTLDPFTYPWYPDFPYPEYPSGSATPAPAAPTPDVYFPAPWE